MAAYKDNGQPGNLYNLKYDKDKHPGALIEIFKSGDGYAAFCAACDIGSKTFYNWVNKHKEFADAYEVAKMHARAWWENRGKIGLGQENFASTAWSMTMRNRFGYTEHRRIDLPAFEKAKTPIDKLRAIEKAVSLGLLTGGEISYLSGLVETGVRVYQNTKMEDDIALIKATIGIRE